LKIVAASGAALQASAGDAIPLQVVGTMASGATTDLPAGATVSWSMPATATALAPDDDTDPSPLPDPAAQPTGTFITNPGRPDRADRAGLLYVLDAGSSANGTLTVAVTVAGVTIGDGGQTTATATIGVSPTPTGDASRGATLYGTGGANCASCHGPTGHGSAAPDSNGNYLIDGVAYDFPAPGLNTEPGNLAGDPDWNAALLAMSARSDVDNGGITLRAPMPDWLTRPNAATGKPLTTQDFADIYTFLMTESQ
jgi:mono/diheme cytochrome c family protein